MCFHLWHKKKNSSTICLKYSAEPAEPLAHFCIFVWVLNHHPLPRSHIGLNKPKNQNLVYMGHGFRMYNHLQMPKLGTSDSLMGLMGLNQSYISKWKGWTLSNPTTSSANCFQHRQQQHLFLKAPAAQETTGKLRVQVVWGVKATQRTLIHMILDPNEQNCRDPDTSHRDRYPVFRESTTIFNFAAKTVWKRFVWK